MKKTAFASLLLITIFACNKVYDLNTVPGAIPATTNNDTTTLLRYVNTDFASGAATDSTFCVLKNKYMGLQKQVTLKEINSVNLFDTATTVYSYNAQNKLIKVQNFNIAGSQNFTTNITWVNNSITQVSNDSANIFNNKILFTYTPNGANTNIEVKIIDAGVSDTTFTGGGNYNVATEKFLLTVDGAFNAISFKNISYQHKKQSSTNTFDNDTTLMTYDMAADGSLNKFFITQFIKTTIATPLGSSTNSTETKVDLLYTRNNLTANNIYTIQENLLGKEIIVLSNFLGELNLINANRLINDDAIFAAVMYKKPAITLTATFQYLKIDGVLQPGYPTASSNYENFTALLDNQNRLFMYTKMVNGTTTTPYTTTRFIY